MDFTKVMKARRSVRKYKADPIPDAVLNRLYEALQAAPTANNTQDFQFIFVKDAAKRRELVTKACHQDFLLEPPVIVVATCGKGRAFDVAIAIDHMVLAAVNEGLGTCWIGWYEAGAVREALGLPADLEVPILVPLGYPDENPQARPRKPIEQLIKTV
jgi:nitroreductase